MRIARLLGLSSIDEELLVMAGARWESWVARSDGALDGAPDLVGLPDWLWDATPAEADRVLVHLAFLAARDGEDDLAAAAVLAWVLLPGAHSIVCSLARATPVVDEVVAAQLWVQVRTFPWRKGRRVAANILWSTRNQVRLELGLRASADLTWRHVVVVDPTTPGWQTLEVVRPHQAQAPEVTLRRLLRRACHEDVINWIDRDLLISLAEAAGQLGCSRTGTASGLLGNTACEHVAREWGCTPRTVRRRARRILNDLRSAYNCASKAIPA